MLGNFRLDVPKYWSISRCPEIGEHAFKLVAQDAFQNSSNASAIEFYLDQRDFLRLCSVNGENAFIWPRDSYNDRIQLQFVNQLAAIMFSIQFNKVFF